MSNNIQAVDRVLQMLQHFTSERRELSVGEFARLVGIHKSTASRLAATLAARGFLERVAGGKRFRLGPEVARLGLLAHGGRDLITLAGPVMEQLSAQTRETINLAVWNGTEVINVAQVDGPHIVGVGNWAGRRTKPHCSANGKVFLAFAAAELGTGPLAAVTPHTITDRKTLKGQIEQVRRQGWASNLGELEEGLHAVAAPVFDPAGRCQAALSVSGPAYRLPPERLPEVGRLCLQAAAEIGARLGGSGEPGGARAPAASNVP